MFKILFLVLVLVQTCSASSRSVNVFFAINPPSSFHPNDNSDGITSDHLYQIFNTLFFINNDGNLVPSLALSWRRIDKLTIEVKLRRGVYFHNGEKFDSESVKLTFDLFIKGGQKVKNRFYGETISDVHVVDSYTVKIKTYYPDSLLPYRLAVIGLMIPPKYYRKVGRYVFSKKPVGTGPFKYNEKLSSNNKTVLDWNQKYWDGCPNISRFNIIYYKNIKDAINSFKKGKLDFVAHIPGRYTRDIMKIKNVKLIKKLVRTSIFLLMNTKKNRWIKNFEFRKALHLGINVHHVLKYGYNGNGKITPSVTVPGEPFHNESLEVIHNDLEKAKKILKTIGYNGETLHLLSTRPYDVSGSILNKQLNSLGISVKIRYGSDRDELKEILEKNINKKVPSVDFLLSYCAHRYALGAFPLMILFHSQANWSLTKDSHLDSLINSAIMEFDFEKQKRKFKKISSYIYEKELVIPLFQLEDVFSAKDFLSYEPHVTGSVYLRDIKYL